MAIFISGMKCPLCSLPMTAEGPVFGTSGVFLAREDPLFRFCDATMHWACYADWPERARFARSYVNMWVEDERNHIFWHKVYLDDDVFVTVNPAPPVESAWVHLYETGSRHAVKLADWATFVTWADGGAGARHPAEAEALAKARASLAKALPTAGDVIRAIDPARKREARAAEAARQKADEERKAEDRARLDAHNALVEALHREAAATGLRCPKCGAASRDYRISGGGHRSALLICRNCARSFDHRDLGR